MSIFDKNFFKDILVGIVVGLILLIPASAWIRSWFNDLSIWKNIVFLIKYPLPAYVILLTAIALLFINWLKSNSQKARRREEIKNTRVGSRYTFGELYDLLSREVYVVTENTDEVPEGGYTMHQLFTLCAMFYRNGIGINEDDGLYHKVLSSFGSYLLRYGLIEVDEDLYTTAAYIINEAGYDYLALSERFRLVQ